MCDAIEEERVAFYPRKKKGEHFMKEYGFRNYGCRVEMAIPGVIVDGVAMEDLQAVYAFKKFAQQLVMRYKAICDQPFRLELWEVKCGGDELHAHVCITSLDEQGEEVVTVGDSNVTHLDCHQYYHAANRDHPEQNYAGKVSIDVYMFNPEATDGDELPVENPAVHALADMAYGRYIATIADDYPEWTTAYINAPKEHVVY